MEKISTKDQILTVSLRLFAENSFHGASIRDIAGEIGKRESSIYNHFKSKDDIFEQIIEKFKNRNFGQIILTDQVIDKISKPEKFFIMLGENLINFWNTNDERMFIKILLNVNNKKNISESYSLESYINDFRRLCEFIINEMIKHKFISKNDLQTLSHQFISPLFMYQLEILFDVKNDTDLRKFLKNHVEFFWNAIKR